MSCPGSKEDYLLQFAQVSCTEETSHEVCSRRCIPGMINLLVEELGASIQHPESQVVIRISALLLLFYELDSGFRFGSGNGR